MSKKIDVTRKKEILRDIREKNKAYANESLFKIETEENKIKNQVEPVKTKNDFKSNVTMVLIASVSGLGVYLLSTKTGFLMWLLYFFIVMFLVMVLTTMWSSEAQINESLYGKVNPHLLCPHCAKNGNVRTKKVTHKKGVSGAKATGALLTGGVSLLATGLSRKENLTEAHCDYCKSTWHF